jgi:hypothetical protein
MSPRYQSVLGKVPGRVVGTNVDFGVGVRKQHMDRRALQEDDCSIHRCRGGAPAFSFPGCCGV